MRIGRQGAAAMMYGVNGLISVGLGLVYLLRTTFMPYHQEALGRTWEDLDPGLRSLLGALMDVAGAGWVAVGVATLVLVAIPMRNGELWPRLLVPALLFIFYIPTLLATLTVFTQTPATPPWYGNAIACGVTLGAFLLDAPWRRPG